MKEEREQRRRERQIRNRARGRGVYARKMREKRIVHITYTLEPLLKRSVKLRAPL